MSDLAYFDYALVLPEERYLIEVQTRKPDTGELLAQEEIDEYRQRVPSLGYWRGTCRRGQGAKTQFDQ